MWMTLLWSSKHLEAIQNQPEVPVDDQIWSSLPLVTSSVWEIKMLERASRLRESPVPEEASLTLGTVLTRTSRHRAMWSRRRHRLICVLKDQHLSMKQDLNWRIDPQWVKKISQTWWLLLFQLERSSLSKNWSTKRESIALVNRDRQILVNSITTMHTSPDQWSSQRWQTQIEQVLEVKSSFQMINKKS